MNIRVLNNHFQSFMILQWLKTFIIIPTLLVSCSLYGQFNSDTDKDELKKTASCGELWIDLLGGTFNGIKPNASIDTVKQKLPCYTGETEEGSVFNYRGGVFYLNHDFYFYTYYDFIQVRKEFKGEISLQVLGKTLEEVPSALGLPDRIFKLSHLYEMDYGILRLDFMYGKVSSINIHYASMEEVLKLLCKHLYKC